MITRWQNELINAVTDPKELFEMLELDMDLLDQANVAAKHFPLKVPRNFIARMQKNNIRDPLLLQVLPIGEELKELNGYSKDPLHEKNANPVSGLLHKYHGRVLLTLTGACAVNCRFCFRRHFPYTENNPGTAGWNQAFNYIRNDASITEVILSGGDPLIVSDAMLKQFVQQLAAIPHLKRVRIHSRVPIMLPERITSEFIDAITQTSLKPVLVLHCNHPQEINHDVTLAMQRLLTAGIILLNQTVLLKNINDNVETLVTLSEKLFAAGIQPYYLHVLDKVHSTQHFDLERSRACELHAGMSKQLSGYLVPRLVVEEPGAPAKIILPSLSAS
jgi:EF-P beta-lysylation protein EpmB